MDSANGKNTPQVLIRDAARLLGVSGATVRNWIRSGEIVPVGTEPLSLLRRDVLTLKRRILSRNVDRLRHRANKRYSSVRILSEHASLSQGVARCVKRLRKLQSEHHLPVETMMFFVLLHRLRACGELFSLSAFSESASWKRNNVFTEMSLWFSELKDAEFPSADFIPDGLLPDTLPDALCGILYQALSSEGKKSFQGSYYTPDDLVRDSLCAASGKGVRNFLDPCCGCGKYLCAAAELLKLEPEQIFGIDIDSTALHIARIQLMLKYPDAEFRPNLFRADALREFATGTPKCATNRYLGFFDLIATNPPWGASGGKQYPGTILRPIVSGETYSLFIAKSLALLKKGGFLSLILPESFLNIRAHADIRELILEQTSPERIVLLGRKFSGVFTRTLRLELTNRAAEADHCIRIESESGISSVPVAEIRKRPHDVWHSARNENDRRLIQKIYSVPHHTLKDHARWALGIVTGDNRRHLSAVPADGWEEVFKGCDVQPFFFSAAKQYIRVPFDSFQQVAPLPLYAAPEKLVYRFISSRLVFAYDDRRRWILNSGNVLIPELPGIPILPALAFLNSSVFQYLFRKCFATHKVLRGDLEKLPFPVLSEEQAETLTLAVRSVLNRSSDFSELDRRIDLLFGLSPEESLFLRDEQK